MSTQTSTTRSTLTVVVDTRIAKRGPDHPPKGDHHHVGSDGHTIQTVALTTLSLL